MKGVNSGMKSDMKTKLGEAKLYGIVDLGYCDEADLISSTNGLIQGGADLIQLRAKGYSPEAVQTFSERLLPYCQQAGVPFIVNDFPEVAAKVGADGVHIGQDDGSLQKARAVVGETMIVGRSTHSKEQAEVALAEGFDYIGFGPLFPTPTKKGRPGIGVDDVFYVESKVGSEIPVFCIGGIKRSNIEKVTKAGAKRIVIVSDLLTTIITLLCQSLSEALLP